MGFPFDFSKAAMPWFFLYSPAQAAESGSYAALINGEPVLYTQAFLVSPEEEDNLRHMEELLYGDFVLQAGPVGREDFVLLIDNFGTREHRFLSPEGAAYARENNIELSARALVDYLRAETDMKLMKLDPEFGSEGPSPS